MLDAFKERVKKGLKPTKPSTKGMPSKKDKEFWRAWRFVTFFGVGTIPLAPGTMGSLAGIVFLVVVAIITQLLFGDMGAVILLPLVILGCFFYGIHASNICMKKIKKHDPTQIVIDEVVGMMLTMVLTLSCLWRIEEYMLGEVKEIYGDHMKEMVLAMFFFFRLMDVVKPWPISWCDENVKGGFGVMLDDVLAAIAASALCLFLYGMLLETAWRPL